MNHERSKASPTASPMHGPERWRPEMADRDWRAQALCAQVGGSSWDGLERGESAVTGRVREAKAVCGRCPVAGECYAYGISTGDSWGIYGGVMLADGRYGTTVGRKLGERVRRLNRFDNQAAA